MQAPINSPENALFAAQRQSRFISQNLVYVKPLLKIYYAPKTLLISRIFSSLFRTFHKNTFTSKTDAVLDLPHFQKETKTRWHQTVSVPQKNHIQSHAKLAHLHYLVCVRLALQFVLGPFDLNQMRVDLFL